MKMVPPPIPNDVAVVPPPSGLERPAASAPVAEFYYPALVKGEMLQAYPLLVWRQAWFDPDPMHNWPKLMDIDRTPFVAWDKRVQ
jgi:hypothetical protein